MSETYYWSDSKLKRFWIGFKHAFINGHGPYSMGFFFGKLVYFLVMAVFLVGVLRLFNLLG